MLLVRILIVGVWVLLGLITVPEPAQASERYIREFLKALEPVPVQVSEAGDTKLFSPADLTAGKELFKESCINCHVGGTTLPNPPISLSQAALHGATPPRDNLTNLVAYMRDPMSYDGTDYGYLCRQVTENWMPQADIENLAAFILRAAEVAPGWGMTDLESDRSPL